jgi:hypothetical protein
VTGVREGQGLQAVVFCEHNELSQLLGPKQIRTEYLPKNVHAYPVRGAYVVGPTNPEKLELFVI